MFASRPDLRALEGLVGLLGDVHAEDELLEQAIRHLLTMGVQTILCVGDVVDGPGSAQRCVELLQAHGVDTVRGNHDEWYLRGELRGLTDATAPGSLSAGAEAFLRSLNATRCYRTRFGVAMLCHGLGVHNMATVKPDAYGYELEQNFELRELQADPDVQVVFNGHNHWPMVRDFTDLTVVNAGTLYRKDEPGFLTVDLRSGLVERFAFEGSRVLAATPLGMLKTTAAR